MNSLVTHSNFLTFFRVRIIVQSRASVGSSFSVVSKMRRKKARAGTRTQNRLLRRQTPYPLGHTSQRQLFHAMVSLPIFSVSVTLRYLFSTIESWPETVSRVCVPACVRACVNASVALKARSSICDELSAGLLLLMLLLLLMQSMRMSTLLLYAAATRQSPPFLLLPWPQLQQQLQHQCASFSLSTSEFEPCFHVFMGALRHELRVDLIDIDVQAQDDV